VTERWLRFAPVGFAIAFSCVPLFPAFITFTNVQFPGVSVVPLPFALVVLALMVVLAVWAIPAAFMPPRIKIPLFAPVIAWLGASVLSTLIGLNPHDGAIFTTIIALGVIWHISVIRYYEQPNAARAIYWSYILSAIVACALAIGMVVTRIPAAQFTIANGRAVGTFVLPGELAGYLIVLLPVAYALARVARQRALRVASTVALALGAIAMVLTFSRTGWIGLACAIAFFVAFQARERRQGAVAGGAIVVAALAVVAMLFNERHNPSENYTRISIWQAAIGAIDRFPLTGAGPFGFSHLYPFVRLPDGDETAFHAHSMYLTILAELGIIGFSAFMWILWAFAAEMRRRIAAASMPARTLGLAIAAGLVGTLVQGLIDTVSVIIFGLLLPMLALALAAAKSGTVDA
jgi:putative inorganic carbon (HCO3(-)) transporter